MVTPRLGVLFLRRTVAEQLQQVEQAMRENWPPGDARWAARDADLALAAHGVREAVKYADQSRKGNLRRRRHPRNLDRDYAHLAALENVSFHVQDITRVLGAATKGTAEEQRILDEMNGPLQAAFAAVGDMLELRTTNDTDDDALARAQDTMRTVATEAHRSVPPDAVFSAAISVAMNLHRILEEVTPLLSTTENLDRSTSSDGG